MKIYHPSIFLFGEKYMIYPIVFYGRKESTRYFTGPDLTEAIKTAPHGVELLDRFPVVGTIEE